MRGPPDKEVPAGEPTGTQITGMEIYDSSLDRQSQCVMGCSPSCSYRCPVTA
jgi:hypothetical protein